MSVIVPLVRSIARTLNRLVSKPLPRNVSSWTPCSESSTMSPRRRSLGESMTVTVRHRPRGRCPASCWCIAPVAVAACLVSSMECALFRNTISSVRCHVKCHARVGERDVGGMDRYPGNPRACRRRAFEYCAVLHNGSREVLVVRRVRDGDAIGGSEPHGLPEVVHISGELANHALALEFGGDGSVEVHIYRHCRVLGNRFHIQLVGDERVERGIERCTGTPERRLSERLTNRHARRSTRLETGGTESPDLRHHGEERRIVRVYGLRDGCPR